MNYRKWNDYRTHIFHLTYKCCHQRHFKDIKGMETSMWEKA